MVADKLWKRWCLNRLAGKKGEFRNGGAVHAKFTGLDDIGLLYLVYTDLRDPKRVCS